MLISQHRRLIFVHVQKTGGETVTRVLREHVPDLEIVGPRRAKHLPVRVARREIRDWDGFFTFAFVRNPWDRLVSWHSMIRDAQAITFRQALRSRRALSHWLQIRRNPVWRYVTRVSDTFEEFVDRCVDPVVVAPGIAYSLTANQLDYLTDVNDRVSVDFVGRFERFEEDLNTICRRVGIPEQRFPHENPSRHGHYSRYYTDRTREIVAERFARDIEHFGYTFESSA